MIFQEESIKKDGFTIHVLRNTKTQTEIHLLPDYGALWHAWLIGKEKTVNLIDNYKNITDLKKDLKVSYKSAKLSPFACRIADGKYNFNRKSYEFLNKFGDGNAIHGLLADCSFEHLKTDITETQIQAVFRYQYRGEDSGYPFDFDCDIIYSLSKDDTVVLTTTIKNQSQKEIPIVDGWHPYFRTGSKIDDCILQFEAKNKIEFNERLVPTGELLPFDKFNKGHKIGGMELDNAFYYQPREDGTALRLEDAKSKIKISIGDLKNYPILQMYIPPSRNSIAIEPLSGAPNAFNNGMGLTVLSVGTEKRFSASFKVKSK